MFARVAMLALLTTLVAGDGNMVYSGLTAQPSWRTPQPNKMATTSRPAQLQSRLNLAQEARSAGGAGPTTSNSWKFTKRLEKAVSSTAAAGGNIVFPGPVAQSSWRKEQPNKIASTSRPPQSRLGTAGSIASKCPSFPPESATVETLDKQCFELTNEEADPEFISLYSATSDLRCAHGFVLGKTRCHKVVVIVVGRRAPPKKNL